MRRARAAWSSSGSSSEPRRARPRWESASSSVNSGGASCWESSSESVADDGSGGDSDDAFFECEPDDSDLDVETPPLSPVDSFIAYMVSLLTMRAINSTQFTVCMYLAGQAGLEKCASYGLKPDSPSGHASRKVNRTLGIFCSDDGYVVHVCGSTKTSLGRTPRCIETFPAHELIDEDLRTDAMAIVEFDEMLENHELPDKYYDNAIVQRWLGSERVWPLSIFIDAVPYSITDSAIGFWFEVLPTKSRYLCAVVRKSICCRCGCRGWCTFNEIFLYLSWCLEALAQRIYPLQRHDGLPWSEKDAWRASVAGTEMFVRAVVLYLKGDWVEYSSTIGVPSFGDALRPCFKCNLSNDVWHRHHSTAPRHFPAMLTTDDDYTSACDRCETLFRIDDADTHTRIVRLLKYDKRKDGNRGLALTNDVDGTILRKGMRVEPNANLRDVGRVFYLDRFPIDVLFWDPAMETLARHRNPLFGAHTGLGITSLIVDILHALYLGVFNAWCACVIWIIIDSDLLVSAHNIDEKLDLFVLRLKTLMRQFYTTQRDLGVLLTRVGDWSVKMLGTRDQKSIRTKGMETYGVLRFLISLCETLPALPQQQTWVLSGRCLVDLIELWRGAAWRLTAPQIIQSFALANRYGALTAGIPQLELPKRHLMLHLINDLQQYGNPWWYDTFTDESNNKILKQTCRMQSQVTFERSVLPAMRAQLKSNANRTRCDRRP